MESLAPFSKFRRRLWLTSRIDDNNGSWVYSENDAVPKTQGIVLMSRRTQEATYHLRA